MSIVYAIEFYMRTHLAIVAHIVKNVYVQMYILYLIFPFISLRIRFSIHLRCSLAHRKCDENVIGAHIVPACLQYYICAYLSW